MVRRAGRTCGFRGVAEPFSGIVLRLGDAGILTLDGIDVGCQVDPQRGSAVEECACVWGGQGPELFLGLPDHLERTRQVVCGANSSRWADFSVSMFLAISSSIRFA